MPAAAGSATCPTKVNGRWRKSETFGPDNHRPRFGDIGTRTGQAGNIFSRRLAVFRFFARLPYSDALL